MSDDYELWSTAVREAAHLRNIGDRVLVAPAVLAVHAEQRVGQLQEALAHTALLETADRARRRRRRGQVLQQSTAQRHHLRQITEHVCGYNARWRLQI